MGWNSAPDYDLNPKERAESLYNMIKVITPTYKGREKTMQGCIIVQKAIIKKLENHGINSEYENAVLKEIILKI